MAVSAKKIMVPNDVKIFGCHYRHGAMQTLTQLQTDSYSRFLQIDVEPGQRQPIGLHGVLQEVFPVESFDKQYSLHFISYSLGRPRYSANECRQLRLTYGRPFRVLLRLQKEQPIDEEVYLGDLPVMIGGGEFIINGAERVVVSQLHRSPGVDFVLSSEPGEKKSYSCRIIPERGSWVELNVTKKDSLVVRIDQSGKFTATTLLRAMCGDYSSDAQIAELFYQTQHDTVSDKLDKKVLADDVITPIGDPACGEVIAELGHRLTPTLIEKIKAAGIRKVKVFSDVTDPLILNTIRDDITRSHEEALLRIYQRLRPGNPPALDKAIELFRDRFSDPSRYRLGIVGRFRINRKFQQDVADDVMTLDTKDYLNAIKYLMKLRMNDPEAFVDDIDNLGNRRLRTIDELASDEIRKGFLKMRRTVQERMSLKEIDDMSPRTLVNPKSITAAIEFFFGRSELSQVVDQTNPLSMLTHERRLSALGPGGLNRKRAGFEVRDVHISHYGRICPIETPEGTNIGLISSLAIFAEVDSYGFLTTPYREIQSARVTDTVKYLRADEESDLQVIPADTPLDHGNNLVEDRVLTRHRNDVRWVPSGEVQYIDVAPSQMVGVSASLIPFLEHDDANRALMGSNMQRQAVPLLIAEKPIVATGMEKVVAYHSGMIARADRAGTVTYVDALRIDVDGVSYPLRKFAGLNERTCLNQKPIVRIGDKVIAGQPLCDTAATHGAELALGRNVLVAFMSWGGYNFEDAIVLSERLVSDDVYTSIHIDEFEIEIRETKLGKEEFTRDIPNVSEKALRNLDEAGIVRVGTRVQPGDILVGKVSPKAKSELTPEEKLLHAIFGRAGEDVKNESLETPSGVEGIVVHAELISRRMSLPESDRKALDQEIRDAEGAADQSIAQSFLKFLESLPADCIKFIEATAGLGGSHSVDHKVCAAFARGFKASLSAADISDRKIRSAIADAVQDRYYSVESTIELCDQRVNALRKGDELQNGVLQMVKVYVASKRHISVGDKMAGRHGNKGVISKILPVQDMPYMADGTPVDIILNPLGVPSRMNVGQILETHLGWAAHHLGYRCVCPVFDGPDESEIQSLLSSAGLTPDGKSQLFDGRTGEPFYQKTTVGYIYMLKLHHLVDDKIHARATGPYSLITQQPLGGKARFGGQRFGEMEVWALEAYGAAYILQELLTVKSDDVEGRTKIYESMVKGENTLEAGTPASFDVLTNEIRGLGINLQLDKKSED